MPLLDAKCTHCGAVLKVDDTKDAAVCQYCNSAFIVEKAVNNFNTYITNNISVDGESLVAAASVETLQENLSVARRSRQKEVWDEAEKAYRIVEKKDPSNMEAAFYSEFSSVKQNLKTQDVINRPNFFNSLINALKLMSQYHENTKNEEEKELFSSISCDMKKMIKGQYVINVASQAKDKKITNNQFRIVSEAFLDTLMCFRNMSVSDEDKSFYADLIVDYVQDVRMVGINPSNSRDFVNSLKQTEHNTKKNVDTGSAIFVKLFFFSFIGGIIFIVILPPVGGFLTLAAIIFGAIALVSSQK